MNLQTRATAADALLVSNRSSQYVCSRLSCLHAASLRYEYANIQWTCRGAGFYNSSKGAVTCHDVYEQYAPGQVASNHEDTIGDCSPCPISLSGTQCATCVGGVIRVKAGHGISQNLASKGLALDAIQAPRPVFLCVLGEDSCLGDAGPNETTPERGAIATTVWWENKVKCNRVVLDGRMSSCTNAGDCVYTPGIRRQERVEFVKENCT